MAAERHSARKAIHLFAEIERRSSAYLDAVALVGDGGSGRAYSYEELCRTVSQLSSGLQEKGLVSRREIGLISENRPEWSLAYLAIIAAGGTVVPIDANLKANEIGYVVDHAQLDVVFCSEKYAGVLRGLSRPIKTISLETAAQNNFEGVLDTQQTHATRSDNETAVLIYTSGTTGAPKAVELTHRNILANIEGIESELHFDRRDVFLSVLPLHHTFEATCGFLTPLMKGARIVFARSLKSKELLEDIGNNRITVMCGVPLLYEKMYDTIRRAIQNAPAARRQLFHLLYAVSSFGWKLGVRLGQPLFRSLRAKAGLSTIRMFVSGGAALPPRIAAFFNLIGLKLIQGYGMTECSPVLSVCRPNNLRFASVGCPLKNVEIRIDNPDSSGVGEILARGENITPGYRGNAEQTDALIRDGWLYTGDLGKMKSGHLYITGRAKNLIISAAGKNIFPEEIEEKLLASDLVHEVIVFGRTKVGKQGEEVRALIVPDIDEFTAQGIFQKDEMDIAAIRTALVSVVKDVNDLMAEYKRITGFDVQLEELEKTSKKSIKRFIYR